MLAGWPPTINAEAPRWGLIALGLLLVSRLDPKHVSPSALMMGGSFLAYAALSLTWTPDPLSGTLALLQLFLLAGVGIASASLADISRAMTWVAIGIAVSALMALPQALGVVFLPSFNAPAGLFFNRDVLAETTAPVFIWVLARRQWGLVAILMIPLALCGSRLALIAAAVGLVILAGWRGRMLIVAGLTAVLIIISSQPDRLASLQERLTIWDQTVHGSSFFGSGLGSFAVNYPVWGYAHSDVLQVWYELGMAAWIAALCSAGVIYLAATDRATRAALAASLVTAFAGFAYHTPAAAFTAAVLAGSVVSRRALVLRRVGSIGVAGAVGARPATACGGNCASPRYGRLGFPPRLAPAALRGGSEKEPG